MSAEDPTSDLRDVITLCEKGDLPPAALEWALSAISTAEAILDTIDAMRADGKEAPTDNQRRALLNYYRAACRWLGHPSEE